ncbi:MAG: methyltransferase domain-containing protein [Dehalococcoidia bacterium]
MIRSYFNGMADIWDENIAEKDTGKLNSMVERLHISPGSTVLDIGSGTGVFIPYLMDRIGANGSLTALDFAEDMLMRCKTKHSNRDVEYLHADAMLLPLTEKSFDMVVCYSCFPHFADKVKALSEIYRVLKKQGRVHICHTSSRDQINTIHRGIPVVSNDLIPDEDEMKRIMAYAGFDDIGIYDSSDNYLASGVKR